MDEHAAGAPNVDTSAERRFIPVPVDCLDFQTLQMDLYLKFNGAAPALYRSAGLKFTPDDLARLAERRVRFLHIPASQHAAYRRSLSDRLTRCFKDPKLAAIERGRIIRESCNKIVEDVFQFAGEGEPVEAVAEVSKTFAGWWADDPTGFSYLLDMSAHDFGTTAHMVNVGVGCGLLMRELEPDDAELFHVAVQGGMLHDIGKRGIPQEILNKEGKLDAEEWKLLKAHPMKGFEELCRNPAVPETVLHMVRDHHEHLNGGGYPQGLRGDKLGLPARVCAVMDVFDAICATRPYRGPTPPAEAVKIMQEGRGTQFDTRVFDVFRGMVDRMLQADPSRAPAAEPGAAYPELGDLLQSAMPSGDVGSKTAAHASTLWQDNKRRYERFRCDSQAKAEFLRQGKPLAIKVGETFTLRVVDVGRGGVQVMTPWPMTINDVLSLEFNLKGGGRMRRTARVARVRRDGDGWASGLAFIEVDSDSSAAA